MPRSIKNKAVIDDIILSNPVVCLANGQTLSAGISEWVSGSSLPGAAVKETRKSRIMARHVFVDSSHAGVAYNPQNTTLLVSPIVDTNATDGNSIFTSRLAGPTNDFFLYLTESQVPIGWKAIGYRLRTSKRNYNNTSAVDPIGLRSAFFSRTTSLTVPISGSDTGKASDYAIQHFDSGLGSNSETNLYVDLTSFGRTPYVSTFDSFAVIWIAMSANSQCFLSGEVYIQRV